MTPEERAELDRLLDLAEREQLMAVAPTRQQERVLTDQVLAEQRALIDARERDLHLVRQHRERIAPDSEWIDE